MLDTIVTDIITNNSIVEKSKTNSDAAKLISTSLFSQYNTFLNPNEDILNNRNRMLFLLKEKNDYKKKVIYSQISIILLIILLIVSILYSSK